MGFGAARLRRVRRSSNRERGRLRALAWALAVACRAGPARAQEIVVHGAHEDARDAASFTTVLRPGAEPRQLVDLADLLRAAADVRQEGGPGHAAEVRLRGAGANQVAVFLDDVPLTGSRGGPFDLSTVPPAYVDRVEVVRGAAAAEYGSGAMGGVVHLRSRRVGPGDAGDATLRVGSFGLRQLDAAWAHGEAGGDLLAVGHVSEGEGDFLFEDVNGRTRRRINNDFAQVAGLARVRFDLGAAGNVAFLGEGFDDERGEPGFEEFQDPDARSRHRRTLGAATWHAALGPYGAALVLSGERAAYVYDDASGGALAGAPGRFAADDDSLGARLLLAGEGALPSLALEGRREASATRVRGPQAYVRDRDEARRRAAAVLTETLRIDPLTLVGAVRLDDTDQRAPIWVPQAGVAWRVFDALSLRANAGRVFRDPSFDELSFYGAGVVGNPDLRPEDGWSWDAGLQLRAGPLSLDAAWFEERYDRLILFVQDTALLVRAHDDFGARVTGQEASAALRLGAFALDAAYTHLRTAFDFAPHPPLPFRPAHRLYARAAQGMGPARAYVAFDGRSARTIDRFGRRKLDGYGLWDLGVDGPVGGGFRAGLEVRNALDERAAVDAVQRPLPGRTFLFALRFGEDEAK
jgi:outer membrane cobalamin receptor